MRNLLLLVLLFCISACETYNQDEYQEQYVVESYQVAGRELAEVRLSTTASASELYKFEDQAVNHASVKVHLLSGGAGTDVEETFPFTLTGQGTYTTDADHKILGTRTYMLEIDFPDSDEKITSTTLVPGTYEITETLQDTLIYQSSEQLEVTLTESQYAGRQSYFVFTSISLNPVEGNLTPFFLDLYQDEDEDLEYYTKNSSGIFNKDTYSSNPDGTTTINYPWIGIAFYRDNLIVSHTIDDNIYDFVRTQQVQLGGSTISPGEIQNVFYNMDGGIGIFGSMATDTVGIHIKRGPDF
ncbi:MAG: DUF4249 family protein [Balneolaceae bacterium]|nr:DUF4249 family protein [Balneolaceae bacterium]